MDIKKYLWLMMRFNLGCPVLVKMPDVICDEQGETSPPSQLFSLRSQTQEEKKKSCDVLWVIELKNEDS